MKVVVFLIACLALAVPARADVHFEAVRSGQALAKTIRATVTAYTPDPRENGGAGTVSGTALGTAVRPGIVAVSRDLLRDGWRYGGRIFIEGLGVFTIEDTMHPRHVRRIDVAVRDRGEALRIGRLDGRRVSLLR